MMSNAFDPGPLADVTAEEADGRWTLVFTRDFPHPPEKVWAAITEPAQLAKWSPFIADRDLGAPGDATITMIDSADRVDMSATVRRADPPKVLEYTLGDDRLRWELNATVAGTRLVLRHTVAGEDWIPKVAAGWHLCLVVAETVLDGEPMEPIRGRDAMNYGWQDLHDRYADRLGIEGTPLPPAG
jgi:uncharacterized protein YndB with AHSA1/START domain